MLGFWFFLLTALGCGNLGNEVTGNLEAQEQTVMSSYSDEDLGLSFMYPECFGIDHSFRLMVVDTCDDVRLHTSVVISVYTEVDDNVFNQMTQDAQNEMRSAGEKGKTFEESRTSNKSTEKFTFQFTFSNQGVSAHGETQLLYFKSEGKVVIMNAMMESDRFVEDSKRTKKVFDSIKLI